MSKRVPDLSELRTTVSGRVLDPNDSAYESARQALIWNRRKPPRFPDALVRPESVEDVAHAVRFARQNGLQVGIRSGGHSWTASFMRDGGILLDMSAFDKLHVDATAKSATVGPAVKGAKLIEKAGELGLFFPGGHCDTVALGGYLLQGGFGWHSRRLGPACASIRSAQVVTADGEIVRVDSQTNADLFWAMRGAGPGFFGVVTEFELELHDRPPILRFTSHAYDFALMDEIFPWLANSLPELSPDLECSAFVKTDPETGKLSVQMRGVVLAESEDTAKAALSAIDDCPMRERAYARNHNVPITFAQLYSGVDKNYPLEMRIALDNAWSDAKPEDLLPGIHAAVESMPNTPPTHFMLQPLGRSPNLPDMAFSMEANIFMIASTGWYDPEDDDLHQRWVTDSMRRLEPHSLGIKVGDENLASRPARFMAPANFARLKRIRQAWDPSGLFHTYMALPDET
ncbi:FAD-binding oxidoreductase [Mesorhizobium sp. M4B.F.Ca.ET.190.01.1.1]|uniref:FAD-binding oxidoreductase n=1 Tax=unclassified Mesorhizobium TaxID=325217 RepID=UPI001092E45D|nr:MULTISPECIES: FAD-binding oxidoreductase [unclassified Mesorhizobium]TGR10526.1 FAD-binding oxidoreductase [Mesorhizobium sp. M4B.F.Ca.ET.200.01.1.1]TGS19616.1 FAD-binding oxidoreductase [Mesorhizobium sp. M4B.F.Ca.ET.190.01.1.1]TGT32418.1 FAD-binding oxidoreductase [Mesorhizobium sp. M4B.F.Ca.ET.172.01.1.1]